MSDQPTSNDEVGGEFAQTLRAHVEQTEDGRWFAHIEQCPGCWNDGDTADEALDGLSDVLRGWLAVSARFGHDLSHTPSTITCTADSGLTGE